MELMPIESHDPSIRSHLAIPVGAGHAVSRSPVHALHLLSNVRFLSFDVSNALTSKCQLEETLSNAERKGAWNLMKKVGHELFKQATNEYAQCPIVI